MRPLAQPIDSTIELMLRPRLAGGTNSSMISLCFRFHIVEDLFIVKARLFSLYDYLASYSVRAELYRQSNIVPSPKPLDVWLPMTVAQGL
jgi:hypothetical protein